MAPKMQVNIFASCLVASLFICTAQGFALRLYNSDFAARPVGNITTITVAAQGPPQLQRVRQPIGMGRFLQMRPGTQSPTAGAFLGFRPAGLGLQLGPVLAASRGPMMLDDCSNYAACKARLMEYLSARMNEQKLDSDDLTLSV